MLTRRCCLLVASLSLFLAGGASADDGYRSARVSDVTGELAVRGEDEDDVSYVERNAIIRAGDVLWTDERSNAEIELERGAWVRLAEDSKLEIRDLPPSAEFRLWTGSVYFDLSERVPDPIRLRTPAGDVDVFPDSVVRVDLSGEESARVSVFNGRAVAVGDGDRTVRLSSGDRAYLEAGRGVDGPQQLARDDLDGFDRYHRARLDYYIARPLPRELDEPLIGAHDLQDYGSWVVVENERYWRPRCEPDWRPYSTGYWNWVPGFGYSWNDYAPWGYATSHYGRWLYRPVYGWLWAPQYRWGPAWVHWSSFDNYYGWAPLDPWGRPCYYGAGNGFNIGFGGSSWFIDYRSWSFCDRDQFFFGRHHRRWWGRGGRRGFYAGHEVRLDPGRFRLVREAHREFGVPRHRVRGLVDSERGWSARERVLRLEDRLPAKRQRLIETRFNTPANRDRERVRRVSEVQTLQRDRTSRIDDTRLVRGDEADRLVRIPRGERPDRNGGNNDRTNRGGNERGGNDPGNRVERGNRDGRDDNPFNRQNPGRRNDDDRNPGNREPGNRVPNDRVPNDRVPGRDRSPLENRNPGDRNDDRNGPRDRNRRGGIQDGDGDTGFRREQPSPPQPPRPPKATDDDRDSRFRRGERNGEGNRAFPPANRDNGQEQRDRERRDAERRDTERRDAERRDAERRNAERRDTERRDTERRDAERRDAERRNQEQQDAQRRAQEEAARRRAEQDRENQRRETERRNQEEASRRRAEQDRENQRREAERRDNERRENERRERERPGRRGYTDIPSPGSTVPATGGPAGGDDRFRRGGGFRDFPGPAGSNPGGDGGFRRSPQPSGSEQRYRSFPERSAPPSGGVTNPGSGSYIPRTYGGGRDNGSRYNRSERPSYTPPAYTPPSGGSSPSYGGRTPSYGGSSPSYGGRSYSSPSRGSSGGSYSGGSSSGRSSGSSGGGGGRSSGGGSSRGSSSGSSRSGGRW